MTPSIFWLVVLVLFCIGEAITVGLTSIWFAVGALGALIAAGLGASPLVQVGLFLLLSLLSLALVRPLAKKFLTPKYTPTNADRIIGMIAVVTEDIDNLASSGLANIKGQVWTARSETEDIITAGEKVKILRIEGVKIIVKKA